MTGLGPGIVMADHYHFKLRVKVDTCTLSRISIHQLIVESLFIHLIEAHYLHGLQDLTLIVLLGCHQPNLLKSPSSACHVRSSTLYRSFWLCIYQQLYNVKGRCTDSWFTEEVTCWRTFDIQFDLFSARSKRTGNVTKPQALFANHEALASSSEYFASYHHTCAGGISLSEYGYVSDSDLDEEGEGKGEGGKIDKIVKDISNLNLTTKAAQCVVLSCRVFVTDTAFNTCRWNTLLYYLYTDEILFAPSRSQGTKIIKHDKLQAKALAAI
ncbi:hypothetical protein BDR06DRAFT_969431 [Suillus hirtellus]|nr:hypothetical protein BDR06DRAFT_969431 [Suillus hirtellus]